MVKLLLLLVIVGEANIDEKTAMYVNGSRKNEQQCAEMVLHVQNKF